MHAGYRNFRPLIQAFAVVLNNKQLTFDPLVSEYNKVRYGLYVIMRACGEYLHELAETEGAVPYAMAAEFIEAGDRNIDLAWVMHLLYDFLYMWWDFKQAVRSNSSKHIDLLWAEFVPYGRTTVANKTHYGVMATLQVYQGIALHPALSQLYHQIRTVRVPVRFSSSSSASFVGAAAVSPPKRCPWTPDLDIKLRRQAQGRWCGLVATPRLNSLWSRGRTSLLAEEPRRLVRRIAAEVERKSRSDGYRHDQRDESCVMA